MNGTSRDSAHRQPADIAGLRAAFGEYVMWERKSDRAREFRLYDGPDDVTEPHDWPADPAGAHIRNRMWELFDGNRLP
ncbi:hypothetical protein [Nocardia cyriacigeorgica]|uniref:hypothetical protein n=1 Tax=Nocardia cyriacigeorgica TaxID=135487 RepID=UPI002454333B|nr:hypothetical protein [Nocardia cyriacigeorgica]